MFENFGINITNLFKLAEKERKELHHPYVGSEHLLLAILKVDDEYSRYLQEYNLTYELFRNELVKVIGVSQKTLEINLYTPLLKRIINNALENAKEDNDGLVTTNHLIISLLEEGDGIAIRLLVGLNIDIDSIYDDLTKDKKIGIKKSNLKEIGPLLNEEVSMEEVVIGRDKEINLIIETLLRKKKNNPLLIGEAGVGKTAIVEELARKIENKDVPRELYNKKIIMLEMGSLVSGTKYRGEFEEKLTGIIKEVENNSDIILFIDEIHTMVSAGGAEGAITAGDIFKPALARGKIKVIGATTIHEYNKYFEFDKALKRRFENIVIEEPNKFETKDILLKIKNEYESHHHTVVSDEIINLIIDLTSKFITEKSNPDKAIDFLDSVCSYVKTKNEYNNELKILYNELELTTKKKRECVKKNNYDLALSLYNEEMYLNEKINNYDKEEKITVTKDDVICVLQNKTNLPLTKNKLHYLSDISKKLKNNYYHSEEYIDTIINTIKNNFLNLNTALKFYLKGNVGLGKSSIVKDLAIDLVNQKNYLYVDLKEYSSPTNINKLLGSPSGYVGYNDDYILSKLRNNMFSILHFDNYECACEEVKNIIKEIVKEGKIRDNKNNVINFNNTIIFITEDESSNSSIGFYKESSEKVNDLTEYMSEVINFKSLKESDLRSYLEDLKLNNIDEIIKLSKYEKYNYKHLKKLVNKSLV